MLGTFLFNCFFLLEWWKIIDTPWLAETASPEWIRPQLLNRSLFFKLLCCRLRELKVFQARINVPWLWSEQRAELITQHEHSHRLKYLGLNYLGFLSAEYCLKQVSGIGDQREGVGEQTAKGCSTLLKHLHELGDSKALHTFAYCFSDPESPKRSVCPSLNI